MKIKVTLGDITKMDVDAIVNAANRSLLGGGGVDGAIHQAGGKSILDECVLIGGCEVGSAVITTAGNLPSKKVIHTVGPRWISGKSGEDEKLKSCYLNCLRLAEENNLKSIAFPNISTGIYRFPKDKAAKIAIDSITNYSTKIIEEVIFVCFDEENYKLYKELI